LFEWFGLEPEKFNGVITGFGPIDWLLQPLGEVAWDYGYTAGEYDAGKVSGWRVALEGAKFGGWLGYYGVTFGRDLVFITRRPIILSLRNLKPIRFPSAKQVLTREIRDFIKQAGPKGSVVIQFLEDIFKVLKEIPGKRYQVFKDRGEIIFKGHDRIITIVFDLLHEGDLHVDIILKIDKRKEDHKRFFLNQLDEALEYFRQICQ
jgi:hypothetical protein